MSMISERLNALHRMHRERKRQAAFILTHTWHQQIVDACTRYRVELKHTPHMHRYIVNLKNRPFYGSGSFYLTKNLYIVQTRTERKIAHITPGEFIKQIIKERTIWPDTFNEGETLHTSSKNSGLNKA